MADRRNALEVIAAFADGERVDTTALRAALADEAGRDYLIDLIAMREIVADAGAAAAPNEGRTRSPAAPAYAQAPKRRAHIGVAAALAVAVGLGGYAIGQQRGRLVPVVSHPPLEAEVIVSMDAPPAPTHVIHLGGGAPGGGGR